MLKKIVVFLALLCTFVGMTSNVCAEESSVLMRTEISPQSPLLLSPVYGNDGDTDLWWGNTLEGAWNAIPDDVKPYAAIELHPAKVCKPVSCIPKDTPELRAWYKKMLDEAQRLEVPVFLVIMSAGERNTVPPEWLEEQFQTYSVLKGVMNIENYWIYNNQLAPHSARYLEVCAKYGAHFIWHDHQKWFWETIMNDSTFFEASKKYHKNLVLATKNTPIKDDAGTDSLVSGFWLSGLCDNWGASSDTWKWWEKHYTKPFETGRARDMRSYASEPESMVAMEMMNVYTGGGTVYNFECAAYTFMTNDVPTPTFTKGILPFFRHAIQHPAPSKEEVIQRTKAVFWNGEGNISTLGGFYTGLYTNDESMPLYSTGQYHILPVIHEKITKQEVQTLFPHATIITKKTNQLANRVEYLNSIYPKLYSGDGYAQRVGNDWYVYNHSINTDTNQQVHLPMYTNNTEELSIDFSAHTYGIVQEHPDVLDITLNNYRTDKTDMWALKQDFGEDKSWKKEELILADWMSQKHSIHPKDQTLRTTIVTLKGQKYQQPTLTIEGDEGHYRYTQQWDEKQQTYTVTVQHNGRVHLILHTTGDGPVAYPSPSSFQHAAINLAYGKNTTQSSTAYGGTSEKAVDGVKDGNFGAHSVTHTGNDAASWWQVDLERNEKIGQVRLFNRTDAETQRLSNFDVILYNDEMTEVYRKHVDTLSLSQLVIPFETVTARYVKIQLLTKGIPLSLAEVEVYPPMREELSLVSKGKYASQSSTDYGGDASRAVDGNRDGDYGHHSVTHTRQEEHPWWQVDLSTIYVVKEVHLYNRTDTAQERLTNFDVVLFDSEHREVFRRQYHQTVDGFLKIEIPNIEAKFVRVELTQSGVPLSLAEVEVYANQQ